MDIKVEARRQYLSFFKIWFIIIGVLALVAGVFAVVRMQTEEIHYGRTNLETGHERVFDEANVLSEDEENRLRELIRNAEDATKCDIVLLTVKKDMENGVLGSGYELWYDHMRLTAQQFFIRNCFGYDKMNGDGVLLIDNWYEDQEGCMLITSGRAISTITRSEEEIVYDKVDAFVETDPYEAYKNYILYIQRQMDSSVVPVGNREFTIALVIVSFITTLIFILCNIRPKEGKVTTDDYTYVVRNSVNMRTNQDMFIRKHVTKRHVPKSSGSSGGGGGSFGGGGGRRR